VTASTPVSGSGTATTTATAARPGETPPRPFADVIKDAKETPGFFTIWRREDKAWIELTDAQLNKPFALAVNISNSVGERGLYASQMGPEWMVEWRKVGNNIQLVALQDNFRVDAGGDKALKDTVRQAFSDSLLANTAVASAPHATKKSFLIDAAFLINDIPQYGYVIDRAFRMGYALDKPNSYFQSSSADADSTVFATQMHWSVARIPQPPTTPPLPGVPGATPAMTPPDARSFFVGYVYTFAKLPEKPMASRKADPRLGHFATSYVDLTSDAKTNNRVHMINRWRLEKKDPKAAMSEPVKPITFWIDKNVPQQYRKSVEAGILEWNKAFEAIGFKGAIEAKQQPDDATWDNMDGNRASIRWFTGADVGFAIGPSRTDPRTGEILDADIGMSDVFARGARRFLVEQAPMLPHGNAVSASSSAVFDSNLAAQQKDGSVERLAQVMQGIRTHRGHDHFQGQCMVALHKAVEMDFMLDVLEARGDLAPDGPEVEAIVQSIIKDVISHEVGHTLGFKHNFKGSTVVKRADLQKPGLLSNSVMDYIAYNLPVKGETKGDYVQSGLGAYDYWAVAYAYSQFAPEAEAAELAKIAARSTEPQLAYADDAEAGYGPVEGLDPTANRFDLGDDPLAYYKKRLVLSRELWDRVQERGVKAGDDPLRSRRAVAGGFRQLATATDLVSKYVGGMNVVRDLPGTTPRKTYTPVDPAKQREALQFVTQGIFSANSFAFKPEFFNTMGLDFNEWMRDQPFNLSQVVYGIQTMALDRMMSPGVAGRLLELPNFVKAGDRKNIIGVSEVYTTLSKAIWSELQTGQDIDRTRRNLQRDHLRRMVSAVLRPGSLPADAQSVLRMQASDLRADLQRAVAKSGTNHSPETRAHLRDALGQLNEAFKAGAQRSL
jgi:hypothetical protein